jgi:hypothetical protein
MTKIVLLLIISIAFLSVAPGVNAFETSSSYFDPQAGFDKIQEPFSNFFEDASKINISQESSSQIIFPNIDQAEDYWHSLDEWLKEKTGLDIFGVLRAIGNILLFIMDIAITLIGIIMKIIRWLLSLIPNTTS